jgi:hypothetical protein
LAQPTQLIVLAEAAFEVASRKKNRPRTCPLAFLFVPVIRSVSRAAQDRLFTEMEKGMRNDRVPAAFAVPRLSGGPVDAAIAGTQPAFGFVRFQTGQGGLDPI